jgi:hypothetical protein
MTHTVRRSVHSSWFVEYSLLHCGRARYGSNTATAAYAAAAAAVVEALSYNGRYVMTSSRLKTRSMIIAVSRLANKSPVHAYVGTNAIIVSDAGGGRC